MLACTALGALAPVRPRAISPNAYRDLIVAYRGRDVQAVHRVAGLPRDELITLTDQFTLIGWPAADLLAAAMMHLDATVELLLAGRAGDAYLHVNVGGRCIDAATMRWPETGGFARRWYAALVAIADLSEAHTWSDEIRQRAAVRFSPTPARATFAAGLALELRGVVEGPISRSDPRWRGPRDPEAVQLFRAAAGQFEKAEALDPTLLEAALHQGRSWMLAGEPGRVRAPLERATLSPDSPVRYLALMLLGAVDEQAGRLDSAQSRYRDAAALAPFAQSAPLALAHLFTRTGRPADARQIVSEHFDRTGAQVAEPLWTYLAAPAGHLPETLQNLRAEVWR